MPVLNVKLEKTCIFDLLSLGEVMLRLDPGEGRIHIKDFIQGPRIQLTRSEAPLLFKI